MKNITKMAYVATVIYIKNKITCHMENCHVVR